LIAVGALLKRITNAKTGLYFLAVGEWLPLTDPRRNVQLRSAKAITPDRLPRAIQCPIKVGGPANLRFVDGVKKDISNLFRFLPLKKPRLVIRIKRVSEWQCDQPFKFDKERKFAPGLQFSAPSAELPRFSTAWLT
jgi:hypothetical protein